MNKKELVKCVAEECGLPLNEVETVISATIDEIQYQMLLGEEVKIRNFGVFGSKWRQQKVGRLFDKGTTMPITSRYVPTMTFSEEFKKLFMCE